MAHKPPGRYIHRLWQEGRRGAELFSDVWNADIPHVAVESPVMHKYAKGTTAAPAYEPFAQSIQPWEFETQETDEDNVKKRTCLWLRNH